MKPLTLALLTSLSLIPACYAQSGTNSFTLPPPPKPAPSKTIKPTTAKPSSFNKAATTPATPPAANFFSTDKSGSDETTLHDDEKVLQPPPEKVSPANITPAQMEEQQTEEDNLEIKLTSPLVKSGLKLRVNNRKIVIGAGELTIDNQNVPVPQPVKLVIPPAGCLDVNDDYIRFVDKDGKATDTVVLAKCRATQGDPTILRGILVPDSLKVKTAPGGAGQPLKKDTDYTLEPNLGAIRCVAGGGIKPGDKVFADYQCYRRRIDTIAFDPGPQHFVLVRGVEARSGPEPPTVNSPLIPLANVFSEWGDQAIPKTDVLPIAKTDWKPSQRVLEHNRKAMAPIVKKLTAGEAVHIVFWGDSVTSGFDARARKDTYTNCFVRELKEAYPKAKITSSNLGIGGTSTAGRVGGLDAEVFSLKPDLIVVEFVNDFGLPSHSLSHSYEVLLDKAKEKNVRIILCAPHCPAPKMARALTWEAILDRPFIPVLKELAEKNDFVALADVFDRWLHLDKEGLRLDMLYVNGLNHPNNRGHAIYAEELMRCFVTPSKIASQ